MKKNILKGILLGTMFCSLGIFQSCQDALDISQPGELYDNIVFNSVDNMDKYLKGSVYANVEPAYEIYFTSVFTDELKNGPDSGGQEHEEHRLFLDTTTGLAASIWLQNYRIINRANRLIEGSKNILPKTDAEKIKFNNVLAQARALRAYAYTQLLAYYSTDMKNDNELGVIIVEGVPETNVKLQRSTVKQVVDVIEADLAFAKANLAKGVNQYYLDINGVNAIAARYNLYRGNYAAAKSAAQSVVANSDLVLTPSTPIYPTGSTPTIGSAAWNTAFYGSATSPISFNPYRSMWYDTQRGETIFSLNRLTTGVGVSIGSYFNTNRSEIGGTQMWSWGRNLFNIFYNTEGDVRRYAYVDPTSKIDPNYLTSSSPLTTDVLVIDKYPGKASTPIRNDIKVFRLSEMYFILAEASANDGNLATAKDYIQKVREARNYLGKATTPTYANKQDALKDILKERRVELALEGHRYIDLKRLAVAAGVSMDRNPTDDFIKVENLPNNDYRYTLPIPIAETAANPTIQQNPGYAK